MSSSIWTLTFLMSPETSSIMSAPLFVHRDADATRCHFVFSGWGLGSHMTPETDDWSFLFFFSDCSTQKLDHLHGGNPVRGWWHHHYYPHRHHYDHHHHHHHHYHHCRYWGCHPSLIFILPFPLPLLPVSISSSHSLFPPPLTFLLLLFLHPSFLYLMFLVVSLLNIHLLLHLYS